MKFDVEYYMKADGTHPAEVFILAQNFKIQSKLFRGLELLESRGNELREPYSSHLDDGIFEVRVRQGSDIARVLYFFVNRQKIILTNGFI